MYSELLELCRYVHIQSGFIQCIYMTLNKGESKLNILSIDEKRKMEGRRQRPGVSWRS